MTFTSYSKLNINKIIQKYETKGFVIVKNFFSNKELDKIDQTLKNIILSISKDKRFKSMKDLNTLNFTNLFSKLKKINLKLLAQYMIQFRFLHVYNQYFHQKKLFI